MTVSWVAVDGAPAGVVVVSDAAREGAQAALAALQKQHLHCAMLTGARQEHARWPRSHWPFS